MIYSFFFISNELVTIALWWRKKVSAYFMLVHFIVFYLLCGLLAHYFENDVLLVYTLQGVSNVANFIIAYEESQ